jgi:hypothetical protein
MMTVASGPDAVLVAIDKLAPELRAQFPPYTCFECGGVVIAVLPLTGRRRHFRHKVATACSGSGKGEGPLHLDAKLRLEATLRAMVSRGEAVTLAEKCPGGCHRVIVHEYVALREGDAVERERAVEQRRPDVAVFRGAEMIAAFEIAVTHYCDAAKWADMRAIATRTVEVEAFDIVGTSQTAAWSPPQSIPAYWVEPVPDAAAPCEPCAARDRRKREEEERRSRALRDGGHLAAERRGREEAEQTILPESWRAVARLRVVAVNEQSFVISRSLQRGTAFGRIVDANGLVWAEASGMVAADVAWLVRDLSDRVFGRIRVSSNMEPSRMLEIDPAGAMSESEALSALLAPPR